MLQIPPFFSICVPTRNRNDTLIFCLRTLLAQDFDSYEIIVSDNCDPEESAVTKSIIAELDSDKLKYFRPDAVLSMAQNYEFALSKALGQFILCIGDDDGLVVNSLNYVYEFIQKYDVKVVKGPVPLYYWIGSFDYPDSIMVLPQPRPVTIVDSKSILKKVANFELGYFNLPMIYYSFVSRDIIDAVIAEKGSFFQNAASIDMYSGFIIAYRTSNFYISDKPFAISGISKKSNGATTGSNIENTVSKEFYKQHNLMEVYEKYRVPLLPQYDLAAFVLLEMTKFVSNYSISEQELKINARKVILNFLSNDPTVNNVDTLKFAEHFRKYPVYEDDLAFIETKFLNKNLYFPFLDNKDLQTIHGGAAINPNIFDIRNVFDASVILRKLIDSSENLQPVYITNPHANNPSHVQQPNLPKRAFNRLKRAAKVLLGH